MAQKQCEEGVGTARNQMGQLHQGLGGPCDSSDCVIIALGDYHQRVARDASHSPAVCGDRGEELG